MLKTWIEINRSALISNAKELRRHMKSQTKLFAVIKSNAYGHGLITFSKAATAYVDGFCVDSVVEASKLRLHGIDKPILVIGPTMTSLFKTAAAHNITITISTFEALNQLVKKIPNPEFQPEFHIKLDTGMNRQGFYLSDLKKVIATIKKHKLKVTGLFSHLASAKDINYPGFSNEQNKKFKAGRALFKNAGFKNIQYHLSATAGLMTAPQCQYDIVRSGIGLYGIYPSKELSVQLADEYKFKTVLSWHAKISEIKSVPKGDFVGYDFTQKLTRNTRLAIVPIGYWHGLPWRLSGSGQVLVKKRRANILGRISMDLTAIDVTGLGVKAADKVTLIGKNGSEKITARELAEKVGTTPYEIITCINPLIHRSVKNNATDKKKS